uniref:PAS domain S-box protein n=1 Tax=candidate division WOR-3 bacterium TaxID=2052148 RepID=A0A7V3RG66_UNCW3
MIRKLKPLLGELREKATELEIEKKRLTKIFEGSRDTIIQINKYGTIVDINRRVKELLGYEPDDLKGKHFAKVGVIVEEEIPKLLSRFNIAVKKGLGRNLMELRVNTKEKEILFMEASINILKNIENEIEGFIVILRDIT